MQGIFSDGKDRLGNQARTILQTHLAQTGRFVVMDRENVSQLEQEANYSGKEQKITGGDLLLTGQITEFGRREVGTQGLWGLVEQSKKQEAYGKASISVVDVATSQVLFSVQAAGVYNLTTQDIIGFGSTSGYDATLNDKVINLIVMDAVNKIVEGLERGKFQPSK